VPVFIGVLRGIAGSSWFSDAGMGSTGDDPGAVIAARFELVMFPPAIELGHMLSLASFDKLIIWQISLSASVSAWQAETPAPYPPGRHRPYLACPCRTGPPAYRRTACLYLLRAA